MTTLPDHAVAPSDPAAALEVVHIEGTTRRRVLLCLFGFSGGLHIQAGGQLHISEIVAVCLLVPALRELKTLSQVARTQFLRVSYGCALWGVSSLLTWHHLDEQVGDGIKLLAVPFYTWLLILVALVYTREKWIYLESLLVGASLALTVGTLLQPSVDSAGNPWKFGMGQGVGLLVCLLATRWSGRLKFMVALSVVAAYGFAVGARSGSGILVAAGLIGMSLQNDPFDRIKPLVGKLLLASVVAVGVATLVPTVWKHYALTGAFGEEAKQKTERQAELSSTPILASRPEFLFAIAAISHQPWVGYGQSYEATPGIIDRGLTLAQHIGLPADHMTPRGNTIPTHSYFLGTWVAYGAASTIFWILVMWTVIRGTIHSMICDGPWSRPMLFVALSFAWDFMFSPYGDRQRLVVACIVVLAIFAITHAARTRDEFADRSTTRTAM